MPSGVLVGTVDYVFSQCAWLVSYAFNEQVWPGLYPFHELVWLSWHSILLYPACSVLSAIPVASMLGFIGFAISQYAWLCQLCLELSCSPLLAITSAGVFVLLALASASLV